MADWLLADLEEDGETALSWWPDGGLPEPVARQRLAWPLDGDALEDLRWYLEDYLRAPFGVYGERGPAVQARLRGWGDEVFAAVFGPGPGRDAYQRARDRGVGLVFRSAAPELLGLPWELMRDGGGPVALGLAGVGRAIPTAGGVRTVDVPGGQLRVLMVISRPAGTGDVGYQMIARPLLRRLEAVRGEVDLVVLRPPTLDALREALGTAAAAGEPFHVVHFDGHGVMAGRTVAAGAGGGARPAMMAGAGEGVLAFEAAGGGADLVRATVVAQVVASGRVPVVVLNACQSGAVGKELEAAVATALLRAGCASVVAMAYSVYAVAAAEFMAAFYEALFAGALVSAAVTAGRRRMFERDARPSPKGLMPLADWLVPVHYLRSDVGFARARTARPAGQPSLAVMLDQIAAGRPAGGAGSLDPIGVFTGRDDLFYQLETAARLQRVVVLRGPGGTGKTELAKAFGRWWRDSGGVDDPGWVLWHSFEPGVASFGLDGVVTQAGLAVFGEQFARLDPADRTELLKRLLAERRLLLIWDNFESVRSMPDPGGGTPPLDLDGCAQLREFLGWVGGHGRSTVIITSRSAEEWLGDVRRIEVGGLNPEEAAEYAGYLLEPYPRTRAKRERRAFGELLEWLDGHPLSMRLTLPALDEASPEDLLARLRGTTPPVSPGGPGGTGGPEPGERLESLAASITYSFVHLGQATRRLLPAVCLVHGVADEDVLTALSAADGVPERFAGIDQGQWGAVLEDAARVGLLTGLGAGMYQVHPALPGYLAAFWQRESGDKYPQERDAAAGSLLDACAALGEWLARQIQAGDAGLAYQVLSLQRRTLSAMLRHAINHQLWDQADAIARPLTRYWDARGLASEAAAWTDQIQAATAPDGDLPSPDSPAGQLWMLITSDQANRDQRAGHLDASDRAYRQILAMLQAQPQTQAVAGNIAVAYHQLGITAQIRGRLDEAGDWYRKSLAIEEELGDRPGMARGYHHLGITAQDRGRLDEADDWYRKSLAIEEELGNRPGMATSYHQLGNAAQDRGRLDEAGDWYRRSLAIKEELGDRPGMADGYHQLGITAQIRGRLDEADDWYRKSLAIEEELGDRPGMARGYHHLGITAQDRGRLDEADDWYRKSLAIEEDLGNRAGMASSYGQLGLLAETRGQDQQALDWLVRCISQFDEFPHPMSDPAPQVLAMLTARLGIPALEASWHQVTGTPLPQPVRDYVTRQQG